MDDITTNPLPDPLPAPSRRHAGSENHPGLQVRQAGLAQKAKKRRRLSALSLTFTPGPAVRAEVATKAAGGNAAWVVNPKHVLEMRVTQKIHIQEQHGDEQGGDLDMRKLYRQHP